MGVVTATGELLDDDPHAGEILDHTVWIARGTITLRGNANANEVGARRGERMHGFCLERGGATSPIDRPGFVGAVALEIPFHAHDLSGARRDLRLREELHWLADLHHDTIVVASVFVFS